MYLSIKRYMDIILSGVLLVFLSPVFLVISLFIKMDSSGGVFFRQKRVGKNGKLFDMIKFRSMFQNAENMGTGLFNYKGDTRVTRIGRFLRDASLDELPQLVNVFKGDMSIVGPRPSVSYELGDYKTLNRKYKKRFEVLPGITGLAQVSGRNELPWNQKVLYDNQYVDLLKTNGFLTDCKILYQTITVIFKKKDIYENKVDTGEEDITAAKLAAEEVVRQAHKPDNE